MSRSAKNRCKDDEPANELGKGEAVAEEEVRQPRGQCGLEGDDKVCCAGREMDEADGVESIPSQGGANGQNQNRCPPESRLAPADWIMCEGAREPEDRVGSLGGE